jgi:hypothetical protein
VGDATNQAVAEKPRLRVVDVASAFDHTERGELDHRAGEPGARDDLDDALDLLVCERRLLGEALR